MLFQDEVCARLQGVYADFQRQIPAKPSGDGGLDGLSCMVRCAGIAATAPNGPRSEAEDRGDLKDEIVKKFNADVRKLFELEFDLRKRLPLALRRMRKLATIMGDGNKIKNVYLVLGWFETHHRDRVIGPLNTHFTKCKKASKLRYINCDTTLTIWGPKDLATLGAVDEYTLFRIENRALFERVQTASAASVIPSGSGQFEAKFNDLKHWRPALSKSIDETAQEFP